jgi:hypothetical protein
MHGSVEGIGEFGKVGEMEGWNMSGLSLQATDYATHTHWCLHLLDCTCPYTDSHWISPLGVGLTGRGEHPPSPVSTP